MIVQPRDEVTSLTRPQLVDDKDLEKIGFAVLSELRVAVCLSCNVGVEPDSLNGHAVKHKRSRISKKQVNDAVDRHRLYRKAKDVKPPESYGPPVEGLEAPKKGWTCNICGKCLMADKTRRTHFLTEHKRFKGQAREYTTPCMLQKIFNFRSNGVIFPVDTTRGAIIRSSDPAAIYIRHFLAIEAARPKVIFPVADIRLLNAFLTETNWKDAVVDCDPSALRSLVKQPIPGGPMWDIHLAVQAYFEQFRDVAMPHLSHTIRRLARAKDE